MKNFISVFVFLSFTGGTCRNPNNVEAVCRLGETQCLADRPYVCGGSYWRPVGDTYCSLQGAICCRTPAGVHACVRQATCGGGAL
jgi:hypothetical protein